MLSRHHKVKVQWPSLMPDEETKVICGQLMNLKILIMLTVNTDFDKR